MVQLADPPLARGRIHVNYHVRTTKILKEFSQFVVVVRDGPAGIEDHERLVEDLNPLDMELYGVRIHDSCRFAFKS